MNKSLDVGQKSSRPESARVNAYLDNWLNDTGKGRESKSLQHLFSTLLQYKWSIVLLFIIGCIAGALKAINEDPIYRAQLTMLVEPSVSRASNQPILFNPYGFRFYETQYEMLRSRTVATRVVDNLQLVDRQGLSQILVPPSFGVKLKQTLASLPFMERIITDVDLSVEKIDQLVTTDLERQQKRNWLVNVIQGGVRVRGTDKSQLIAVSFDSPDPEFAAEIANQLVEAYINTGLESQLSRSEKTSAWLVQRLEQVRKNLTESEQQLQNYLLDKGAVDLQRTKEISSQQLSSLNQEYIAARARYDELSKRYGSKHPRITAARSELYAAKARYDNASKGVGGSKQKEFELSKLERDIEVNQQLYDLFLTKFREADLATSDRLSSARIIDKALAPSSPIHPDKQKIVFLWGLAGLFLGMLLAFLRDQLDTTFKGPQQLEDALQMPLLGVIPRTKEKGKAEAERQYLADLRSPFAESINHIRTGIVYSDVDNPPKIVLVTSSVQGEGKTTTSSNLALSFAQLGKTLLIDADLRRPRIKNVTQTHSDHGLVDYVAGAVELEDCIVSDHDCEQLDILNCGMPPPNPLELLASVKMRSVLEQLCKQYDHVIIDTAPILPASDAIVLGQIADAIVMVVEADKTRSHIAEDAVKRLHSAHVELTGLVLSQANIERIKSYRYGGYYSAYYQAD
ncbi:MAG: GumC family protein [Arenicella sp.]